MQYCMCVWVYIYKSRLTTTSQPLSNYFIIINCKLQSIYDDQKMLQPYNEIINSRNMTWMRAHEWIEIFLKFLRKKKFVKYFFMMTKKSYNFLPHTWAESRAECLLQIHFCSRCAALSTQCSMLLEIWESHHNKQQIAGISLRTRFEVGEIAEREGADMVMGENVGCGTLGSEWNGKISGLSGWKHTKNFFSSVCIHNKHAIMCLLLLFRSRSLHLPCDIPKRGKTFCDE